MSPEITIGTVPSAEGAMLARVLVAIDATNSPLERAIFRGDLAELMVETPVERRPLALLMLLARIDRALASPQRSALSSQPPPHPGMGEG